MARDATDRHATALPHRLRAAHACTPSPELRTASDMQAFKFVFVPSDRGRPSSWRPRARIYGRSFGAQGALRRGEAHDGHSALHHEFLAHRTSKGLVASP